MLFSRYKHAREEAEVNLIPVMNLFVTLIPFLLMCAAFYHVGVIPTSLPTQSDGASSIEDARDAVTVNLHLDHDRIQISAVSATLDEEVLAGLTMTVPRTKEGYDLTLLGNALFHIKNLYPASDTVIVLPEGTVEYQEVVRVLDTAREQTLEPGTPEEHRRPLFPVVVLSRMLRAEAE